MLLANDSHAWSAHGDSMTHASSFEKKRKWKRSKKSEEVDVGSSCVSTCFLNHQGTMKGKATSAKMQPRIGRCICSTANLATLPYCFPPCLPCKRDDARP